MKYQQLRPILRYGGAIVFFSTLLSICDRQSAASAPLPPPRIQNQKSPVSNSVRRVNLYRVWIPGTNRWVLNRVRSVEPGAFIRRSQGAIQAGLFSDPNRAQLRITQLTSLGFRGKVTTLPLFKGSSYSSVSRPTAVTTSSNSIAVVNKNLKLVPHSKFYFVVVPGGDAELATVEARLVGSGIERQAVLIRNQPLGSHIALGPFEEHGEAKTWSKYLRGKGMDARVYFDR